MSIRHKSVRLARVLYRQTLRLLPRSFYALYAEQMALDFDDLLQDSAHQGSLFFVAKTLVGAVGDVFLSAVRERLAMLHGEFDAAPSRPASIKPLRLRPRTNVGDGDFLPMGVCCLDSHPSHTVWPE